MRIEATSASLPAVKRAVENLARKIASPGQALPTYGRSEDFARPHIEVSGQTYHYVVVERGEELQRKTTEDINELLYWIFKSVVFELAVKYELQHRIDSQDSRRAAFAKEIELMGLLDASWASQIKREIDEILVRYPFSDAK